MRWYSYVRVEYRLDGATTWTQEVLDLSTTEYVIEPPGGTYHIRVALVNTEGLATTSGVQTVTIQDVPEVEGQGVDITTVVSVTVVVAIVVIAVTAIVITVLVLRQRKSQHTKRSAQDRELHTYENQSVPSAGQPPPPNQPSDPVEYDDVPAPVQAQYQGMDPTGQEPPVSEEAYIRIPADADVAQVEEQYQEVDATSREPPRGNDEYAKIQMDVRAAP